MIRTILAASVAALAVAGPAMAQDRIPAEFPPESYTANQYVDSEGCAFIRAGIGGATNWIPRMSREREPLCGFQPSRSAIAAAEGPVIADSAPAAPAQATAPARRATAPVPAPRRAEAAPRPSSPRVVAPPPAVAQAAAPVLTRAAFCANRSGPQPGYVSSLTGETIVCGVPRATAPGAPLRGAVTLAAVCADMAATGRRYVLQGSGEPVTCGPQRDAAPGLRTAATHQPAGPVVPAAPASAGSAPAARLAAACDLGPDSGFALIGAATYPRRCGPQAESPSGLDNAARPAPRPRGAAAVLAFLDPQADLRRAAAAVVLPDPVAPPPGYTAVWEDGRLNRHRGVRIVERTGAGQLRAPVTAAPVAVPTELAARVSTRSAPAVATTTAATERFVQIGAFAEGANAERAAARLRALGLPVAHGSVSRGGTRLRVVAAGPFDDASLNRALGAVRAAGYTDAFARR